MVPFGRHAEESLSSAARTGARGGRTGACATGSLRGDLGMLSRCQVVALDGEQREFHDQMWARGGCRGANRAGF